MNFGGMLSTGVALARAGAEGSGRAVGSALSRVAMMATGAGAKLSALTGGLMGQALGTGMAIGGGGLSLLLVLVMGAQVIEGPTARRDSVIEALCQDLSEKAPKAGRGGTDSNISANQEEQAKAVYSVLKYAGMNEQNIAGILGNFQTESNIDPTAVENIFDEPFQIGPRKKAAEAANFQPQPMGIGLGQWTAERTYQLLDYAKAKKGNWYDIGLQLAFAMSEDSGAEVFQSMIDGTNPGSDDPAAAAKFYLENWERPANMNQPERGVQAGTWYAKMGSWSVDSSLASSVLSLAQQVRKKADAKAVAAELDKCPLLGGAGTAANSDAAKAAATLAWPYAEDSHGNDGTDLYRYIHDQVYPGDQYYASCDRTVGTAIRWSGTDDDYPPGPVSEQSRYLNAEGKDKWEKVGPLTGEADLKPGDVLITNDGGGHTFMYAGKDAIDAVWHGKSTPDGVIVSGSLNDRSPGVNNNGELSDGRSFTIYRAKGHEQNSKYKSIKAPGGMTPGKGDKNVRTTPG